MKYWMVITLHFDSSWFIQLLHISKSLSRLFVYIFQNLSNQYASWNHYYPFVYSYFVIMPYLTDYTLCLKNIPVYCKQNKNSSCSIYPSWPLPYPLLINQADVQFQFLPGSYWCKGSTNCQLNHLGPRTQGIEVGSTWELLSYNV